MKFIKLTGADTGTAAYVNVDKINAVHKALDGKTAKGAYVSLDNNAVCEVRESVEDIMDMLAYLGNHVYNKLLKTKY